MIWEKLVEWLPDLRLDNGFETLRAWIRVTVRNEKRKLFKAEAADLLAHAESLNSVAEIPDRTAQGADGVLDSAERTLLIATLNEVLRNRIPELSLSAFMCCKVEGLSIADAAVALGLSRRRVRDRVAWVQKRLRVLRTEDHAVHWIAISLGIVDSVPHARATHSNDAGDRGPSSNSEKCQTASEADIEQTPQASSPLAHAVAPAAWLTSMAAPPIVLAGGSDLEES
jgi:DNA-directed RNA polymerase specialized sigma24 family protein